MGGVALILCRWNNNWYLSSGVNRAAGICWLRSGANMPRPSHFAAVPPVGSHFYGQVPLSSDIAFFPKIYYHGLPVTPLAWSADSSEPMLHCCAMPSQGQLDSPYFARVLENSGSRLDANRLVADGWLNPERGVYEKYVHVDEIEMVEGAVPDGPF